MTNVFGTIRWASRAFLLMLACLALPWAAHAQSASAADAKLDLAVRASVQAGRSVRAIVQFKDEEGRLRGAGIVSARGGRVRRAHADVTGLAVDVDAATVSALAYDAGVSAISLDAPVRSAGIVKASKSSGASKVRSQFNKRGGGIAVAVIDSGVAPHADLPATRIRAFVDFVNGRTQPYDDFGHGTHVAGIIAGSGAASAALGQSYAGVAPSADIVSLKVLDGSGAGTTSDVIAALEWVGANHRGYNIRVVNLSLGHPVYERAATDPLVRAAEALVKRGIVVVAAAGNLGVDPRDGEVGYGGVISPANGRNVIAVGAVDSKGTDPRSDDRITNYSSRGPSRFDLFLKPDVVASGHHVVSLSAPGSYLFDNFPALQVTAGAEAVPAYMMLSGTSMAAPVVAGTAALVLEANPGLSSHAVRAILSFTAQHIADTNLLTQGAGYLNALGAVRLATLINSSAPLGTIWLTTTAFPSSVDSLYEEAVAWGKKVIWGQRVLLGNFAYINMFAWKDTVRWGKNLESMVWGSCGSDGCDNVVWGNSDNVVWGNSDNVVWGNCADAECNNVVWGNCSADGCDNVVWGNCADAECSNVVWGNSDNVVWGNSDNVVWGNFDNVVWGNCAGDGCDNVVWGNCDANGCDNVVWGNVLWLADGSVRAYWASNTVWGFWQTADWTAISAFTDDNVVWGNDYLDNVVWGNSDNVVWGNCGSDGCDNVVWGNSLWILTDGGRQ